MNAGDLQRQFFIRYAVNFSDFRHRLSRRYQQLEGVGVSSNSSRAAGVVLCRVLHLSHQTQRHFIQPTKGVDDGARRISDESDVHVPRLSHREDFVSGTVHCRSLSFRQRRSHPTTCTTNPLSVRRLLKRKVRQQQG